ncbi:MAG: TIM barrel protein [Christensenellales bacterium]
MSGHCNLMDPERIPDFEKNIRLAAFFGCQYIVSSDRGGASGQSRPWRTTIEVGSPSVAALIPMLEQHNLTLVLETHGKEHGTGEKLARIVREIDSRARED